MSTNDSQEAALLKQEFLGLFKYISRVRQEIAMIDRPADEEHDINRMGDQLDAIVAATETATNSIMTAMERNQMLTQVLREKVSDPKLRKCLDEIDQNGMDVFEACSFQDITGQRVNKVIKSITYVEDRVNALVNIWGKDELEKVDVQPVKDKTEDEKLLQGPQLEGKGLGQDEIDKLFD